MECRNGGAVCPCAYSHISRWDEQVTVEMVLKTNVLENKEDGGGMDLLVHSPQLTVSGSAY
jgi:hypothetical protein